MDLLELNKRIADNKKKLLSQSNVSFFDSFISHYNLTIGIDRIPTHVLYYAYISLIEKFEEELPLNQVTFYKELKTHFKPVRWGRQRYYLLDRKLIKNINTDMEFKANLWKKNLHLIKEKK